MKNIFTIIKWLGDIGDSLLYYPTLKLQCHDLRCKRFPIFFRGARINPVSNVPEDRKCITLTSSNEDGMISHNRCNLVSDILEEECDSIVALFKIRVESH